MIVGFIKTRRCSFFSRQITIQSTFPKSVVKLLIMTYTFRAQAITLSLAVSVIAGCGPESNSRYGDDFWDPQSTWDKAVIFSQPELNVVYRDTDNDPVGENWEAYLSIDFSDVTLKSQGAVVLSYTAGTMEKTTVSDFVQAGSTDADAKFYYDSTNLVDYRLKLTDPETYTFYLDFSVTQPNGTSKAYNYSWSDIVLPGTIMRDDFWANRMNALVEDNCHSCHGGGATANQIAAAAAFSMNNSSVTNLRTSFVNKINSQTAGKELPAYAFSGSHTGAANAAAITGSQRTDFNDFVNILLAKKAETPPVNITTNVELKTIAKPSVMENDPHQ